MHPQKHSNSDNGEGSSERSTRREKQVYWTNIIDLL